MEVKHKVDQMKFGQKLMDMKRTSLINFMIKDWIFVIQSFLQKLGEEVLLRRW